LPRPLLFWREKKIQNSAGKKNEPKKVFWVPLKQKSKQTKKKQNKPKKGKQTQKDLKQKKQKHFILCRGDLFLILFNFI